MWVNEDNSELQAPQNEQLTTGDALLESRKGLPNFQRWFPSVQCSASQINVI